MSEIATVVCAWHIKYNPTSAWLDGEVWNTVDPIPEGRQTHGTCPDCGEKAKAEAVADAAEFMANIKRNKK